jgi:hypothetical protein
MRYHNERTQSKQKKQYKGIIRNYLLQAELRCVFRRGYRSTMNTVSFEWMTGGTYDRLDAVRRHRLETVETETLPMMKKKINKRRGITLLLALAVCFAPPAIVAEQFSVVGPGGGGAMFNATVSPHDQNEALVSCDMTGSYISHNGGKSWRMFNLRGTVKLFAFDPVQTKTIYAATEALWRSTDDGASWKLVWPRPSTIRGVRMSSDHADETIVSDGNAPGRIVALAIDPADSHTLVAGAVTDATVVAGVMKGGKAAVFVSRDDGATWV